MNTRKLICLASAIALVTFSSTAWTAKTDNAAEPADAATLAALGYPEGAGKVFRMPQPDAEVTAQERRAGASSRGGLVGFYRPVTGASFLPLQSSQAYEKGPSSDGFIFAGALVNISGSGIYEYQLQLPQGAILNWLDIFGYHAAAASNLSVALVQRCQDGVPGNAAEPVETILVNRNIGNQSGSFVVWQQVPENIVVNKFDCSYHLRTVFGANGISMQLYRVAVEYTVAGPVIFQDRFQSRL